MNKKNNYRKILLDTNFMLVPYEFGVDIFSQIDRILAFKYKLFVLDKTFDELKNIAEKQRGRNRDAAKIALKLIAVKNIGIVKTKSDKKTDEIIVELSLKDNYIVATQDKDLKRTLINHGVEVVVLRQKKFLALTNDMGF